jgi:hypothetical protein
MTAPLCTHCEMPARLTTGGEIYPHRPDLHEKSFWKCDACFAWVGCHPGTVKALGRPADFKLRNARTLVHLVLDPLWQSASDLPCYENTKKDGTFQQKRARRRIEKSARSRTYAFLASKMKIKPDLVHTGEFNIDQCRQAWKILSKETPESIRTWAKERQL